MDEVTIWNRSFTTNEIQSLKNLPLIGNESGLVGYWRLDETNGTTVAFDSTANGHTGSLVQTARNVWVQPRLLATARRIS